MEKDLLDGLLNDLRYNPVAVAYRAWTLAHFAVAELAAADPGPGGASRAGRRTRRSGPSCSRRA
ncbi:MAG: hypothetical protein LBR80_16585 [Deltaproteobacteria bacterium]|jgi:hypothetical protein|nr:hypothetical protein [Deltaproteobacteria bacterium]